MAAASGNEYERRTRAVPFVVGVNAVARDKVPRDGRKVALNQEGEVLCAFARKILALHSEAQSALRMPSSGHMHGVQVYIHIIVNKNENDHVTRVTTA